MEPYIFSFVSARAYLTAVLEYRKNRNPAVSIRWFAKFLQISSSVLAVYLSGKSHLSLDNTHKIIRELEMSEQEAEYFLMLSTLESLRDQILKDRLFEKVSSMSQVDWPETQREVYGIFEKLESRAEFKYRVSEESRFRVLTFYFCRESKQPVKHFCDHFFTASDKTAGTGYFLPNSDGSFRSYLEKGFSQNRQMELVSENNTKLKVNFDKQGFPTIQDFTLSFLDSDHLILGKLAFSSEKAIIDGKKFLKSEGLMNATNYRNTFERID